MIQNFGTLTTYSEYETKLNLFTREILLLSAGTSLVHFCKKFQCIPLQVSVLNFIKSIWILP